VHAPIPVGAAPESTTSSIKPDTAERVWARRAGATANARRVAQGVGCGACGSPGGRSTSQHCRAQTRRRPTDSESGRPSKVHELSVSAQKLLRSSSPTFRRSA
jgi:hypothetical protein